MSLLGQDGVDLTGRVQGTGGTVIARVKLTLVNQETQMKQETMTAEDGSFIFSQLAQGGYLLGVEASGFEPYRTAVQIGTEEPAPLKIKLKLRTVAEEVVVRPEADDDRVSPESNTESMKIDEAFFGGLPLPVAYLQPFIDTFVSPAAQGNEGTSVVVDGMDGGELDMPSSAIRSVKINRNPYSAEFQHPGSARAEVTTKHGHKHRYEGSLAFYSRNSTFDARNAFAISNPNLNRRFVDGSLGGPLPGRNGSFFIAGQRLMDDESAVVDAVTLTGPVNMNVPAPQRRDHLFARAQWSLTEMQTLSLNYTFTDHSANNDGVGGFNLAEQGISAGRHTHRLQMIESAVLSPQFRNEVLFVFKDQTERSGSPASAPEILVAGAFTGGPSQTFFTNERRAFDAQDTATYIRGKHTFLFGATTRTDWVNASDATNFGGTFQFASLAEFAAGTPDLFTVNQGNPRISFLAQQTSGFAQDQMRVLPSLSVTFGLRYDWENTVDDRKGVAPRLALAFSPGKRKKTVLRAGIGMFHDHLPRSAVQQALLVNGVRVREIVISNPSYPDPFLRGQVTSPLPSITQIAPQAQSPYLMQTSAGVEQELWKGSWLSLEYSFLRGVHLFRLRDVNAPQPLTGARPDPNFLNVEEIEPSAFLRGHALTATFRGALGKQFKGYAQYVFSKYINDTSGIFSLPADNYDLRGEIGPADFDRRHRVNLASILQFPLGFRIGTIFSAASGAPFNITTGSDLNGDTLSRPPGVTRNTGRSPGMAQLDVRLSKIFSLRSADAGEHRHSRRNMEFSVDAFNAINHTNVTGKVGVQNSPLFGLANSAAPARTLQMSVKYSF